MRVAIVQLTSTDDLSANLANAEKGIQEAAARGAEFVALPENFAYMRREGSPFPCVQGPDGELLRTLARWARDHRIWLLGGSFPEAMPEAREGDLRVHNTSLLYSPEGEEVARYRKIHLFDVDLGEQGEDRYRESLHFAPGSEVVVAPTPFGNIGLSICYDLRFPELYRAMADRDVHWIVVPSAFTRETGRDHWEVLLRARAIENQAWVVAPAQCGQHGRGHGTNRASYGRSMIISPWGLVIAQAGDEPKVLIADCPSAELDRVRRAVPALTHRRLTKP